MLVVCFLVTRHLNDSFSVSYTDHILTRLKLFSILNLMLLLFLLCILFYFGFFCQLHFINWYMYICYFRNILVCFPKIFLSCFASTIFENLYSAICNMSLPSSSRQIRSQIFLRASNNIPY